MSAFKTATPAKSSADDPGDLPHRVPENAPASAAARSLRWPGRVALLALNFVPALHAASVVLLLVVPPWIWPLRIAAAAGALWLAPALCARVLLMLSPLDDGRHLVGSRVFWTWWTTLQLQTLFLRLPALEEGLRLLPGAYSAWLRVWGSRVGRLTYWAPGLEITDRSLLEIGDDVVTGGKVRLGAHLLRRDGAGELELVVGRIRIGDRCMIGAQSVIGPGACLEAGEATPVFFLAPPFSRWRDGKTYPQLNDNQRPRNIAMKLRPSLFPLVALLSLPLARPLTAAPADDEAAHAALRALKTTYENAVNAGDLAPLKPLFTEGTSAVMVLGQEVKSYEELVEHWDGVRALIGAGGSYHTTLNPEPSVVLGDVALSRGTTDDVVKTDDGREFRFNSKWTAVSRRIDGQWKVLRLHASMDPVTNVFTTAFQQRAKLLYGLGGGATGVLLGFLGGLILRRKSTRP